MLNLNLFYNLCYITTSGSLEQMVYEQINGQVPFTEEEMPTENTIRPEDDLCKPSGNMVSDFGIVNVGVVYSFSCIL